MDIQKEKIAHEKHLLSQGVDFKYLPNIQYSKLENVYELIEWDEEYSEALNEINSSWCTWQAAKAQAVPEYAEFYLGGGVFAICDWKDYETVKNFKWNTSSRQSRTQWVWAHDPKNADINRRKVAMHNLIMCPPEGLYVDHINGNGLDNRRSNLRIVTKQQNTFNSAHKGGTSKYKGVCLEKESGMWKAYITKDGKKKSIGRFALEDDAARAYDKEAISLFREHAKLNFLPKAMIEAQGQSHD